MESLGYVLLYSLRGSLPWQGFQTTSTEEKYGRILESKQSLTSEQLCDGLPRELVLYFHHVRSLRLEDEPNYGYLRRTFSNLFRRRGFEHDNVFDWTQRMYSNTYGDETNISI